MKKALSFVGGLLLLVTLACGFNASTANIAEAKMARDADGNNPTTVFAQDDIFYAVVQLANAPDDTKVKAVWIAVEADGTDPNLEIDTVELTSGSGTLNFNLTNDKLWPVGKYKVDLYLNDELNRSLEFEVEGEVAAAPEPTATPEPTPEPTPTPEPEPTNTPRSSSGDTLGSAGSGGDTVGGSKEEDAEPTEEPEPEVEPLPFKEEPYVHPSGAFTFALPESFEGIDGDESSVLFGTDRSRVGAIFLNSGQVLAKKELERFIDSSLDIIVGDFDENYEVIAENDVLDESGFIFVAASFDNGNGRADLFFDQRDTIVFIFYFITLDYDEMESTWRAMINSYDIDADAALKAAPAATSTPRPQPPAATPAPAANPFAPPPGVARVFMQNQYGNEYNIDFGDGSGSIAVMPGAQNFYRDVAPGKYRPGLSLPGGGATNVEFEIQANEAYLILVTQDLSVRWGKVYP